MTNSNDIENQLKSIFQYTVICTILQNLNAYTVLYAAPPKVSIVPEPGSVSLTYGTRVSLECRLLAGYPEASPAWQAPLNSSARFDPRKDADGVVRSMLLVIDSFRLKEQGWHLQNVAFC